MKRTYIKPLAQEIVVAESLLRSTSWSVGKYDGSKVNIDDPTTDMGKVFTDQDIKGDAYDPWNSDNW